MDAKTVSRDCPVCGINYLADPGRLKHGRQTTCSRACSYAMRADGLKNEIRLTCPACQAEFVRTPAQIKGKHGSHFCSRACHYAGRGLGLTKWIVVGGYDISDEQRRRFGAHILAVNARRKAENRYGHSDATRAKMSIATARSHAEGRVGRPSKLEGIVAGELDRLGISYVRQKAFRDGGGRFAIVLDFWLTAENSAIEVNGTYWHADPRVYTGTLNATQVRNAGYYRRKLDTLRLLGIGVGEAWELDLKRDPAKTVLAAYARATGR